MKPKAKRVVIAALSICLAAGIGLGAVLLLRKDADLRPGGMSGELSRTEQPFPDEEKLQSGLNADAPLFDATLTGQPDAASMHFVQKDPYFSQCDQIIQTENGWYYLVSAKEDLPATWTENSKSAPGLLYYKDNASGESVVVCADAACTHYNEYCMAANTAYHGGPAVYYEDALYGVAKKYSKPTLYECNDPKSTITLMRYAPDGTAMEELAVLEEIEGRSLQGMHLSHSYMIAHGGALWMIVNLDGYETPDAYGIYRYDVAAEELTFIMGSSEKPKDDWRSSEPMNLMAEGNYVYFAKPHAQWPDTYTRSGIYRIDARTGCCELLAEQQAYMYRVMDNKMVYIEDAEHRDIKEWYYLYQKDLESGESVQLDTRYVVRMQCNGSYILTVDATEGETKMTLYDRQGKALKTLFPNFALLSRYGLAMDDTDCYVQIQGHGLFRCSIADILADNPKWEMVYSLSRFDYGYD